VQAFERCDVGVVLARKDRRPCEAFEIGIGEGCLAVCLG
jgi:hypothetical protein